mmetsp:Transcript_63786/g.120784  ORF Transcript_63786/g.120784 Transcript_63786/m.120784 type:complete len:215 (+) Transcript_63786:200-844(+)
MPWTFHKPPLSSGVALRSVRLRSGDSRPNRDSLRSSATLDDLPASGSLGSPPSAAPPLPGSLKACESMFEASVPPSNLSTPVTLVVLDPSLSTSAELCKGLPSKSCLLPPPRSGSWRRVTGLVEPSFARCSGLMVRSERRPCMRELSSCEGHELFDPLEGLVPLMGRAKCTREQAPTLPTALPGGNLAFKSKCPRNPTMSAKRWCNISCSATSC